MTFGELLTELNYRIAAAQVSGFWSDEMKKEWINRAGERICNFRRWQILELAKYTYTKKGRNYYEYPKDFKPNSIYYLEVDGAEYAEKTWDEFQKYKAAGSTEKIFASHNGFYFINPTPTEDNKEITIYGIRKWEKLVNNDDVPVLPSDFDEAIIKLALATCLQKEGRYNEAEAERAEVEAVGTPGEPGTGGILWKLAEQIEDKGQVGYIGRAESSRWLM